MHLFIVRHGECLGQCDPAYGDDPDSPLSARGQAQARWTGRTLQAQQVSQIISSPLLRSLATAHVIAEAVGLASFEVWLELREAWDTPYRGSGRADVRQRFPRAVLPATIGEDGWDHPGDRDYAQFVSRATAVLARLRAHCAPTDRVVLVTHGGFGNALLHAILQIDLTTPHWFELANGSISHVRLVAEPKKERPNWPLYPPVGAEVRSINQHMPGDGTL